MNTLRTSTTTLIAAMRTLSSDIESQDGVANAAILEAAERLEEMSELLIVADGYRAWRNWPQWFRDAVNGAIK